MMKLTQMKEAGVLVLAMLLRRLGFSWWSCGSSGGSSSCRSHAAAFPITASKHILFLLACQHLLKKDSISRPVCKRGSVLSDRDPITGASVFACGCIRARIQREGEGDSDWRSPLRRSPSPHQTSPYAVLSATFCLLFTDCRLLSLTAPSLSSSSRPLFHQSSAMAIPTFIDLSEEDQVSCLPWRITSWKLMIMFTGTTSTSA